jgi:hypothetical protein
LDSKAIMEQHFANAFGSVMSVFQETYKASGTISAQNYAKGAGSGKATSTGNSQLVQPSGSDLTSDVCISARRVLDEYQIAYWDRYYKTGEVIVLPEEEIDPEVGDKFLADHLLRYSGDRRAFIMGLDWNMRVKLGERFIDVDIFPLDIYNRPVDVRDKKAPKNRWSHLYGN